jgi:hypothetical protein
VLRACRSVNVELLLEEMVDRIVQGEGWKVRTLHAVTLVEIETAWTVSKEVDF